MALPAIPPFSFATLIPPLPELRQPGMQDAFTQALGTSVARSPTSLAALTSASSGTQALAALEQTLFADWLASIQNTDLSPLSSTLDSLLAGQLGTTAMSPGSASQSLLSGASGQPLLTGQSLLTSSLISLFNTIQMLGTEANQSPQVGSLLDLLA